MTRALTWIGTAIAAALVAGCATAPTQIAQAPPPARAAQLPLYRWTEGDSAKAHQDSLAAFGAVALKPGDFRWVADVPADGEAKVVIDLRTQLFYVYRDGRLAGMATISSGKKGKETPLGLWAVRIKQKLGHSRKYDNAPMPFMQMYDPKGIAFHAGRNPGYPASHGCVRLPLKFAERLYGLTKIGTKVVVEG